ncbi:hypothetical protein [Tateyamaria sp. ANG-S1]|uniref:hypothetical protein n=1 Tax=Tateyamaria sp. ANG-S1 TaxID=1577905 RepID=UPI00057E1F39|nr:hypothetical protein [Tateyamaria sp. ANG-S1]KIC51953.1 hypothetical protein RA29_01280 [Tateyamaria sp. ANG-S1]
MTVVRNLPTQLILAHAPWLLGGGLIVCIVACAAAGLALLVAGETAGLPTVLLGAGVPLGIFALAIQRDQVIFDARAGTVTIQRRTLLRYRNAVHPLAHVRHAEVEAFSDTARPTLTFHDRPTYPLVEAYVSGNGPKQTADAINDWLRAYRRSI